MALRVNWCNTCGWGKNFGDNLTPLLLTHYGIEYEWSPPGRCDLIGAGSILSKVPRFWRGAVWGSGFIRSGMMADLRNARVLALRGQYTRAHVKMPRGHKPYVLGDPGILVSDLPRIDAQPVPTLLMPHYVDHDMVERHPGLPIQDITAPSEIVLGAIASAGVVITSSLHALIAADALGVPHVLEPHPRVVGGLFKFQDYASAFDDQIVPGRERLTDRMVMGIRQAGLRTALWQV